MIKLIGSDIDGTLTKEGSREINPEYFQVIRELKEVGISFVLDVTVLSIANEAGRTLV